MATSSNIGIEWLQYYLLLSCFLLLLLLLLFMSFVLRLFFIPQQAAVAVPVELCPKLCICSRSCIYRCISVCVPASIAGISRISLAHLSSISRASIAAIPFSSSYPTSFSLALSTSSHSCSRFCFPFGRRCLCCCLIPRHVLRLRLRLRLCGRCQVAAWYRLHYRSQLPLIGF